MERPGCPTSQHVAGSWRFCTSPSVYMVTSALAIDLRVEWRPEPYASKRNHDSHEGKDWFLKQQQCKPLTSQEAGERKNTVECLFTATLAIIITIITKFSKNISKSTFLFSS